ncbi:MAG: DUF1648 domain-containing protein [Terracidiphilus sp.]|jgi:uncharacterized membrane protein
MRKLLEALSLACLAAMAWITYAAFNGPEPLPERIPIHFDAAGNANGWGSPAALIMLPVVAAGLYVLITVISLLPTGVRSAVQLTAESRERIQTLTRQMLAWIKAELTALFLCIQWFILAGIREGTNDIPALAPPAFIVVIFATVGWHLVAVFRAMRPV